jgi:hypothetical protein
MNNQHTSIQIERFLRSLMETAEREAFLQQIETDPALARQVRIHKVEIAVMEELETLWLRKKIRAWNFRNRMKRFFLGSAGVLFVALALFFVYHRDLLGFHSHRSEPAIWPQPSEKKAPAVTDTSFQEKNKLPAVRPLRKKSLINAPIASIADRPQTAEFIVRDKNGLTGRDATARLMSAIESAFEAGRFKEAIRKADTLVVVDTLRRSRARLLLGTLLLYDQQFVRAAQTLEQIEQPFREEAAWNLLLAYRYAGKDYRDRYLGLFREIRQDPAHTAHLKLLQHAALLEEEGSE